ncbi:Metallo-dependent hydrolase [Ophiobolus disseminans]|uniref:Metallo-dependent hydrolase n=1 Tax=Ophiobolus disseminans TaxID=1469910 RepID=A0A6A6ZXL4_9PLEO|nr:Metallo-dependent hydrolase [Ophiobolus disseminans]
MSLFNHISALCSLLLAFNSVAVQAATLFTGGTVVSWSNATNSLEIIRNGSVLVEGSTITAIYTGAPPNPLPSNLTVVNSTNDIISTGFIDTHRHSWQTAFKTLGSNTTLLEYFSRYGSGSPAQSVFTPEDVYLGQLLGYYEALNAGVTTIVDYAHSMWSTEHAYAAVRGMTESGVRGVFAYQLADYRNFTWNASVGTFRRLADDENAFNLRVDLGVAYDGYSRTGGDAEKRSSDVLNLARQHNVSLLTTHANGGVYGSPNSPEEIHRLGFLNQSQIPWIFAHASYISIQSQQLLRQTNHYISITPESEMHYGHDHPTSHLIQDQASLGVDTHFTFSTDILTQARIWLQHVRQTLYRDVVQRQKLPANNPMSVTQAFLLATRNGALALHRTDIGILAPAAKADLIIWNGRSPSMLGWSDPIAAIMLHASISDIKHVMVDGVFKKRDGRLVVEGYEELQDRFLESVKRIQRVWGDMSRPVLQGISAAGVGFDRTVEVDVVRGEGMG